MTTLVKGLIDSLTKKIKQVNLLEERLWFSSMPISWPNRYGMDFEKVQQQKNQKVSALCKNNQFLVAAMIFSKTKLRQILVWNWIWEWEKSYMYEANIEILQITSNSPIGKESSK